MDSQVGRLSTRCGWKFFFLAVLLVGAALLEVTLGSAVIPLGETVRFVTTGETQNPVFADILRDFRLPRALTAATAGATLAVAGLLMQTLFRNPLADPFVLGINSGASLGVALVALALGPAGFELFEGLNTGGNYSVVIAAAVGSGLVLLVILYFSRRVDMMTLLIIGLMLGYGTSAIVNILMHLSAAERLQSFISWTFGDFSGVDWRDMRLFLPACAAGSLIVMACVKPLNALLLGEQYAQSLGVHTGRLRFWLILASALMAGAVTAYCGPIGFIGVAVPHFCRGFFHTSDHRLLFPACLLAGAVTGMLADTVAQVPGSAMTLPLNAITALIGAPVILWILLRRRWLQRSFEG